MGRWFDPSRAHRGVVAWHASPVTKAYPTPEEAALAWEVPASQPRIVAVLPQSSGDVLVITDTVPSHLMETRCRRTEDGWVCLSGGTTAYPIGMSSGR